MKNLILDGNNLNIQDIEALVKDSSFRVQVSNAGLIKVKQSKKFLDEKGQGKDIIYGVNTGFGPMASHIIDKDLMATLQENLVRSHAVGMGQYIDSKYVLAAMIARLNALAKGYSGVSVSLIHKLEEFINLRIIPLVPEHGAVGTSGDLVQLAHIALAVIGEGEVLYKDQIRKTKDVLKELDIQPHQLELKEGLALINATAMMSGIASLLLRKSDQLLALSVRLGALAFELMHGFTDSLSERAHNFRPHVGQISIAKVLRTLLIDSKMTRDRKSLIRRIDSKEKIIEIPEDVQQVYSLRCIPQILGPVFDSMAKTKKEVEIEINAVTDNPIVDWEGDQFLHGGNFHGDYIAASMDQLKMGLVKLTILSERRTNFFLDHKTNRFFPPFMNLDRPGLTLGLQGLQFVATSTTAQSQTYAFPHSVHSISTNGSNQDVVSMGTDVALIAAKVIENAFIVLAIELITLAQGVDFLNSQARLSSSSRQLYDNLRKIFPAIKKDRELIAQLAEVVKFVEEGPGIPVDWNK